MTTERAWWITIVAVLALTTSAVELRGQTIYGQPSFFYPPQSAPRTPYAGGNEAFSPAAYQPGWPQAVPAGYYVAPAAFVETVPAYFQQPEAPVPPELPEPPEPEETETLQELWDQQETVEYYSYRRRHGGGLTGAPTLHELLGGRLTGGLWRMLALLAPYSEGGCCAPHWFDIHAEAVFLEREKVARNVPFTSLSFPSPPTDPPNIVLSSNDLQPGTEAGLRVTGTFQTGPGSNLEVTYLGMTHWAASASVTNSVDRLWSPFSEFGTNPPGVPYIGYDEVDRADFHGISLKTTMNTIEANYRRRWVGPTCLFQGSYLMGFRYFQLRDKFNFNSLAPANIANPGDPAPFMNYDVTAVNHMYGFQIGTDTWVCLMPGLNVGGGIKAGIFGNDTEQRTSIEANSIQPALLEEVRDTKASFVGEADLMATYRIGPKFTIRGGYMFLYAEGLTLAAENFNPAPPLAFGPVPGSAQRIPGIKTGGNAFWYGWTIGAEYMW